MSEHRRSDPLVSVVVATRNSRQTLGACLQSIVGQSHKAIELIVVDNHSTDGTLDIARDHTDLVFTHGPERSAQRNLGVQKASGQYVLIVDSDMELDLDVVRSCAAIVRADRAVEAVIIPEESFGTGFWAQCKRLERSFYIGVDGIEAPRFFTRALYQEVGGYNERLVSGEDWDLSERICARTTCRRTDAVIRHNEGRLTLLATMRKKYYYARLAHAYFAAGDARPMMTHQAGPVARFRLFFSHPAKLLRHPAVGAAMLFMKSCEYGCGGAGYLRGRWAAEHGSSHRSLRSGFPEPALEETPVGSESPGET